MRASRFKLLASCLILAIAIAAPVHASDAPEIEVGISTNDIFQGESIQYQVTVKNVKSPAVPDMDAFKNDFNVKLLGDQPRNESSVTFINGRISKYEVYAHIYLYELTPKRAGELPLPSPSVTVDGKAISGPAGSLRVRAPEKQDIVILELLTNKPVVYPTQPIEVTVRVLLKPIPGHEDRDPLSAINPVELSADIIKAPDGVTTNELADWIRPFRSNSGHGFTLSGNGVAITDNSDPMDDIFSVFEQRRRYATLSLYTGRESRPGLDGKQISYFVYELKRSFTPLKTGTFSFGPATLKGNFIDGVAARKYSTRRLVLGAPAKEVTVREVPSPAPATFCGGIGAYSVEASATPAALRVGDPLTYKIKFERKSGSGSLDLISAPNLAGNAELSDAFDILDKNPTGETKGDVKIFSYGLRPRRVDVKIPALTITTFDPNTEKFTELSTHPIDLKVVQSSKMSTGEVVSGARPQSDELRNREGGIFQNFTNMAALQDQRPDPALYAALAVGMWVFVAFAGVLVTRQRRLANDAAWQRRQRARPEAEHRISEARAAHSKGNGGDAAKSVRAAVAGMIGNMLDLPAAGMTAHEAAQILDKAGVNGSTRAQTIELLETIEALEYSPGAGQDNAALISRAETLIPVLQRELNKR
jgi:hypothetical protein